MSADIREEIRARCAACAFRKRSWPTCAHCASSRAISWISLSLFQLNEKVHRRHRPGPLASSTSRIVGPWLYTILFEIPVLAIVNEVYFRNTHAGARLSWKVVCAWTKRSPCCAAEGLARTEDRRLRHPAAFLASVWHDEVLRVLMARLGTTQSPGHAAGTPDNWPVPATHCSAMRAGAYAAWEPWRTSTCRLAQALGPRLRDSQMFGV
jgi:nicotinate phosphoribosyltransferase